MGESYPLLRDGKALGSLTVEREGLLTRFRAESRELGNGLFRAVVRGETGELLLGIMEPKAGLLAVDRSFTRDALRRAGLGRILCAEIRGTPGPGNDGKWYREERPQTLIRDRRLAASAKGPCMVSRRGKNVLLFFPYSPASPFPLTALFCFGTPERREGRLFIRYVLDENGFPGV